MHRFSDGMERQLRDLSAGKGNGLSSLYFGLIAFCRSTLRLGIGQGQWSQCLAYCSQSDTADGKWRLEARQIELHLAYISGMARSVSAGYGLSLTTNHKLLGAGRSSVRRHLANNNRILILFQAHPEYRRNRVRFMTMSVLQPGKN
jgi:hypothetical protein